MRFPATCAAFNGNSLFANFLALPVPQHSCFHSHPFFMSTCPPGKMADMRVRASIQATAALGQKLAGLLQTLVELNPSSHSDLKDVHYDVEATSGTLRQILDMYALGLDESLGFERDTKSVVTSAYLEEIEKLAVKCGLIYKSIILVTQKAGARGSSKEDDDKASSVENLKDELLSGPIPDPGSIKWVKLVKIPTVYDQRQWLGPRFERLQEQLQWIRTGLLIHLHIFKLALLQNGYATRYTPPVWDGTNHIQTQICRAQHRRFRK